MALPVEFFTQRHAGDIANRVGANEQIGRLLSSGVAANALNLTSIIFFAAAMAIYDLPLAVIGVGMTLVNVLALQLIGGRREDLSRSLALEQGKLIGATVSAVRSIETLKASGLEDEAFGQWAGIQAKALNAEQELGASSIFLDMVPTLVEWIDGRSHPWRRRPARDRGLLDAGRPRRLPVADGKLLRAGERNGQLFRQPADHQGRARAAGGRLQLPARRFQHATCPAGALSAETDRPDRTHRHPVRILDPGSAAAAWHIDQRRSRDRGWRWSARPAAGNRRSES